MKGRELASTVVLLVCLTARFGTSIAKSAERPKGTTRRNGGQRGLLKGGKGGKAKHSKKEMEADGDVTALEAKEVPTLVPP